MRKVSTLLFLTLLLSGCTTLETSERNFTYAPFLSSESLDMPLYVKNTLIEKSETMLHKEAIYRSDDYLECDTYLFVSITIEEGEAKAVSLYPQYDPIQKKTIWLHLSQEREKELHLDVTLYDGRDLRDYSVYTPLYKLHSSHILTSSQLLLDIETLIAIYGDQLFRSLKEVAL